MNNADHQVLAQLTRWIEAGEMCWLATVVKTWGSSPRPVGSLACCNSQGHMAGSLSGGCIEDDLLENLQNGDLAKSTPEVLVYGKTQEDSDRFGLPCGGQLHVVIEPMPDERALPHLKQIVVRLGARQCIERKVDIATGAMTVENKERFRHLQYVGPFKNTDKPNEAILSQIYGPRYQLVLIGAGQVSMYLAEMAQTLDYHVIVCDPREHMLEQWNIDGVQLTHQMPDEAVNRHVADSFTAVITLTHDPRIDDMALMEALKTDAFYIAKRRERLLHLDLSEHEIARLHAPVGLPIGSKTPAEIAISILAQLTALRAEKQPGIDADFRQPAVQVTA